MDGRVADRGQLLFVYGTLLAGQGNHGLLGRSRLVGAAATEPRFELIDLGCYPALIEGGRTAVLGEVYAVDGAVLARTDRLEGHPDYYRRQSMRLGNGQVVLAYVLPAAEARDCPVIPGGDWRRRGRANGDAGATLYA